jgi:hypothetical protein
MHARSDEWVGRIPGEAMKGKSIQYYIEVRDASGNVTAKSGGAAGPNIISITEGAKPQFYADLTEGPSGGLDDPESTTAAIAAAQSTRAEPRSDSDRPLRNYKKLKWTTAGVAAGALALGTTFALLASGAAGDLEKAACQPPNCTMPTRAFQPALQDSESSGKTYSTIGTVMLITGVAAAGASVVLFLLDDSADIERAQRGRRFALTPVVGPESTGMTYGVSGAFSF